jgi:hypothetical protein
LIVPSLIGVNARARACRHLAAVNRRSVDMPTDIAIIVTGIVAAFVIFGAALAWAEMRTRDLPR